MREPWRKALCRAVVLCYRCKICSGKKKPEPVPFTLSTPLPRLFLLFPASLLLALTCSLQVPPSPPCCLGPALPLRSFLTRSDPRPQGMETQVHFSPAQLSSPALAPQPRSRPLLNILQAHR